jgi:hypothetical protein
MSTIPVIGVPIVNGIHWLERLVSSVDYPVDTLLIINNNGKGELDDHLAELSKQHHQHIRKIHVCNLPSNIGVSGAWNLIVKSFITAPYWFICNHDIQFTPGLLETMVKQLEDPANHIVHANGGEFNLGTYDLFALTDRLVKMIGLFDENLYPAYGEDIDYVLRITRHNWNNSDNPIRICNVDYPFYHGDTSTSLDNYYELGGSQTKKHDTNYLELLDQSNLTNFEYLTYKWGDNWRMTSPQLWPFNIHDTPISFHGYDLDFVRKKYLGF